MKKINDSKKNKKKKLENPAVKNSPEVIQKLQAKLDERNNKKHAGGRPTIYTDTLGKRICDEIKNSVRGLDYICENNDDLPFPSTIREWLSNKTYPQFSEWYAKAKRFQADNFAEEIIEVAYNAERYGRSGGVEKEKLQVDALKWVASRLSPKKWGEKPEVEEDKPDTLNEEELKKRIKNLFEKADERRSSEEKK